MAGVDLSNHYRKKADFICVIFSKSWFLKLLDKGMESCETFRNDITTLASYDRHGSDSRRSF